jgi:hypothetical protein
VEGGRCPNRRPSRRTARLPGAAHACRRLPPKRRIPGSLLRSLKCRQSPTFFLLKASRLAAFNAARSGAGPPGPVCKQARRPSERSLFGLRQLLCLFNAFVARDGRPVGELLRGRNLLTASAVYTAPPNRGSGMRGI